MHDQGMFYDFNILHRNWMEILLFGGTVLHFQVYVLVIPKLPLHPVGLTEKRAKGENSSQGWSAHKTGFQIDRIGEKEWNNPCSIFNETIFPVISNQKLTS